MSRTLRRPRGRRTTTAAVAACLLAAVACSAESASGGAPRPGGTEAATPSGVAVGDAAMLADLEPGTAGSFAGGFVPVGDRLVFTAAGTGGGGLWVTDGAQVAPLGDVTPYLDEGADQTFTEMDGVQYFAGSAGGAVGLWRTDATRAGTRLVAEVGAGEPAPDLGSPEQLTVVGDTLWFVVDGRDAEELWRSDGTTAGTTMVSSRPRSDAFNAEAPTDLVALGDTLLFAQDDPEAGRELWASDGTAEGTRLVADIFPGAEGSRPLFLTAVGDQVFFAATDATHGNELWRTDGTEAGTRLMKDVTPGRFDPYVPPDNPDEEDPPNAYSALEVLGALDDERLLFSIDDGDDGDEPWVSDGTAEGTHLVADIDPCGAGSDAGPVVVFKGSAYFSANDRTHGQELWRTDGTAGGTALVADIVTEPSPYDDEDGEEGDQPGGPNPRELLVVGDRLHFTGAGDGTSGGIWRTDGTAAGTELVVSLADATGTVGPVRLGSSTGLGAIGDDLFFGAAEELHGAELWSTSRAALAVPRVRSVERPAITGDPVVGGTLTATPGTFTPARGVRFTYRWYVGFDVVEGEDDLTYTPRAADVGQVVGFRVVAKRPGLEPRSVRAVPTALVE